MPFGAHAAKSMTFCQATWKPQCGYCTATIQNKHDCMCSCIRKRPVSSYRPLFRVWQMRVQWWFISMRGKGWHCSRARRFKAMSNSFCLVCLNRLKPNLLMDCYWFENNRLIRFWLQCKPIYRPHVWITNCACDVISIEIVLGKSHWLDYYR